jgi:hypothetical protein
MSHANLPRLSWIPKLLLTGLILAALAALSLPALAQDAATAKSAPATTSYVDDWSQHHVVFSNPGTEADAIKSGHYSEWLKIVSDPRYVMQQQRRGSTVAQPTLVTSAPSGTAPAPALQPASTGSALPSGSDFETITPTLPRRGTNPLQQTEDRGKQNQEGALHKDWSMFEGALPEASQTISVSGTPGTGTVTGGTSTVTVDGQTFTANAPTAASQTGTFSTAPTSTLSIISVKVGANTLSLNTNAMGASATANVSAIPTSAGTTVLSIVNNDGTVNMTPTGATAAPVDTVTFTAMPTTASSNVLSIANSTGTVNMAPTGATAGSAGTVTVTALPTSAGSDRALDRQR